MNFKAMNGWIDKSFTELLGLVKDMLLEGNTLPNRNYEAKKVLCSMGMEYKKMHSCPNDCILYRNEYKDLRRCPRCGLSRYKVKVGQNDEIDEFTEEGDAKNLRRHAKNRKCDGLLCHPTDSLQWKNIDKEFPKFGKESRNLRFGLATDGMNPFGNLRGNYSSWPVLLVIYNLPHALCMKCKYMMLSMMISGPKQLGNDIDVYLNPLIEDLK